MFYGGKWLGIAHSLLLFLRLPLYFPPTSKKNRTTSSLEYKPTLSVLKKEETGKCPKCHGRGIGLVTGTDGDMREIQRLDC